MNTTKGVKQGMNEALKHKWHSVYGQILNKKILNRAWLQVKKNKGAGGIDGVTLEDYEKKLESNLDDLLSRLQEKRYNPSPVRRKYIAKKNGKLRPLGIPNIEDRIVQQAVVLVLQPKFEEHVFHKWSCGYRPNTGIVKALQVILWNIETDHNHVYDCDIKGFFDNIPHKKLMQILNKYVADGTVLNLVWKWLKAGYMEDGIYYDTETGTPQGGVISPLLANIYLNELDWELEKGNIRFVRYADDFLLLAKTKAELQEGVRITSHVLEELGLEISNEKTKVVNFNDDDFDFLGFTFGHWEKRKKDGKTQFTAKPKDSSWEDFRQKVKELTPKKYTLSAEKWFDRLNPVITGKVNNFLNLHRAVQANRKHGQESRCEYNCIKTWLKSIDKYTRQRLRVAMIHKGAGQRKGHAMKTKWNNSFFAKAGLIPAFWLYYNKQGGGSIDDYLNYLKEESRKSKARYKQRLREKGEQYYTPERNRRILNAERLAST